MNECISMTQSELKGVVGGLWQGCTIDIVRKIETNYVILCHIVHNETVPLIYFG